MVDSISAPDDEDYEEPHTAAVQEENEEGSEASEHFEMSEHEEDEQLKIGDGQPNKDKDSNLEDSGKESSDKEGSSG